MVVQQLYPPTKFVWTRLVPVGALCLNMYIVIPCIGKPKLHEMHLFFLHKMHFF